MFEKVLRAFAEGDIHYADVQLDLKRLLIGGASPEKLLEVLQRWELIDPLQEYAREGIVRHLNEAIEVAAAQNANLYAAPDQNQAAESPPAALAPGPIDRDAGSVATARIAQARHSLDERDAQLTALQKEHAKIAAALEARAKAAETELKAARARIDTVTADLKASHAAAAALSAQRERGDSHLAAVRTELGAVQARSSSYLEVLQTHEWRRELAASADAEAAGIETQRAADLPVTAPVRPREPSAKIAPLAARQSAPRAALQSERAARSAKSPPVKRDEFWKRGAIAPAAGLGVAILVLVFVFWFFAHRAPAPTPVTAPAVVSVVAPEPGTAIRDCPTCPGMTLLPAGRFKQGSAGTDSGSSFDKPQHWVVIGRPFAMSTNVVTLDEFREFITATGHDMQGCDVYDGEWKHQPQSSWENPGFVQTGSHPVTCTSWADAQAYAAWLSTKTGHRYRLPSASEWEYAARAGGEAEHPWNPDGLGACASANVADQSAARRYPGWTVFGCDDGHVFTAPVGSFKASAFGLNDMLGNVFQWTEDCWHEDYKSAPIDGSARTDGECSERELRGGSWFTTPAFVRASYRNHFAANYRTSSVGIRLIRDLAP